MGLLLSLKSVTVKTAMIATGVTDMTVTVIAMAATEIEAAIESDVIETEAEKE